MNAATFAMRQVQATDEEILACLGAGEGPRGGVGIAEWVARHQRPDGHDEPMNARDVVVDMIHLRTQLDRLTRLGRTVERRAVELETMRTPEWVENPGDDGHVLVWTRPDVLATMSEDTRVRLAYERAQSWGRAEYWGRVMLTCDDSRGARRGAGEAAYGALGEYLANGGK